MPKRRASGEGCVHQRKDGRWMGYITVQGQRRYATGKTRKVVLERLANLQTHRSRPGKIPTLTELTKQLLETRFKLDQRGTTWETNHSHWRNHIARSELGQLRVDKIRHVEVQAFIDALRTHGYRPATVRRIGAVVSRVLSEAVRMELISHNPAQHVIYPTKGQTEKQVLTPEQVKVLSELQGQPRLRDMLLLAVHTGLRRGELCGLHWSDVDFDERAIQVRQQLVRYDGRVELQTPKTRAANRSVMLTEQAVEVIQRQPRRGPFVFSCEEGTPVRPDNLSRDYRALKLKLGLGNIRLHDFRASFTTFLFEADVDPRTVQELLGHTTSRMTQEVYARSRPETKRAAIERLTLKLTSTPDTSSEGVSDLTDEG